MSNLSKNFNNIRIGSLASVTVTGGNVNSFISQNTNGIYNTFVQNNTGPSAYMGIDGPGFLNTSPGSAVIGSSSGNNVIFTSNNTERMRLTSAGNLGIGTITPQLPLDVIGNIRISTNQNTTGAITISPTIQAPSLNLFGENAQVNTIHTDGSSLRFYNSSLDFGIFSSNTTKPLTFYNANLLRMAIATNGNVGIGTTSPQFTLDVTGATRVNNVGGNSFVIGNTTGATAHSQSIVSNKGTIEFGIANGNGEFSVNANPGDAIIRSLSGKLLLQFGSAGGHIIINTTGNVSIPGALSKGSGTFDIQHPLKQHKSDRLVHSFVEGPRCDLIYRNTVQLVNGSATVDINIDSVESIDCAMSPGTFEALCKNIDIFLQNKTGFARLKGSVSGSLLTIECEENTNDTVSWMVVGERKDPFIKEWNRTNTAGSLVTEYSWSENTN